MEKSRVVIVNCKINVVVFYNFVVYYIIKVHVFYHHLNY